MGVVNVVSVIALCFALLLGGFKYHVASFPDIAVEWDACFKRDCSKDSDQVQPAPVHVPKDVLQDLQDRITKRRLGTIASVEDVDTWEYGIDLAHLESVMTYWETQYDWSQHEKEINSFNPHETTIQGIDVHFLHVRADRSKYGKQDKIPTLLMLHGWPGSIYGFHTLIPKLVDPLKYGSEALAVDVVVPSLPGYGFSSGATKPGMSACQIGAIFFQLMERLGYDKFMAHGGDWGAMVIQCMAEVKPEVLTGIHMNQMFMMYPWWGYFYLYLFESDSNELAKVFPLKDFAFDIVKKVPYALQQATAPDTIGAALHESPTALAAWYLDKFHHWTDPTSKITKDELITNLMIYWVTNSATSAGRLYKETFWEESSYAWRRAWMFRPLTVKTALSEFPYEISTVPRAWLSSKFKNIVDYHISEKGGHFANFEVPDVLLTHLHSAILKIHS